jgi:hypothetical protein
MAVPPRRAYAAHIPSRIELEQLSAAVVKKWFYALDTGPD